MLTKDPWILQVVQGKAVDWLETPYQVKKPQELHFSQEETQKMDKEIMKMLEYGAIEPCQESVPQFISTVFLSDGVSRPIFNLKQLNQFTKYEHFKLEGIPALLDTIQQGDYMYKIDLKNALVPVHPTDKKWLRFRWKGKLYQFLVSPF